jgi:hypothetical protein
MHLQGASARSNYMQSDATLMEVSISQMDNQSLTSPKKVILDGHPGF